MVEKLFVTVGTTSFPELIDIICSKPFVEIIKNAQIESVKIQYGAGKCPSLIYYEENNIKVEAFDYKNCITNEIKECDILICHAGAGSICEGLERQKKLLVVINETLMNNHQTEIAYKLEKEGYIIHCTPRTLNQSLLRLLSTELRYFNPASDTKLGEFLEKFMSVNQ